MLQKGHLHLRRVQQRHMQAAVTGAQGTPIQLQMDINVPVPKGVLDERRRNRSLQLQAVCICVTDSHICQHRFHWPDRTEMHISNRPARVWSRNHKLGVNGRDSPTDVLPFLLRDALQLRMTIKAIAVENAYLIGVRAAVPRSVEVRLCCSGAHNAVGQNASTPNIVLPRNVLAGLRAVSMAT
jgi:hypothetical protein